MAELADGDILLLENTRFHKGEEKNDPAFTEAARRPMATSSSTTPSRPPIAPMPRPRAWRTCCPPIAGRTMQAELEALEKGLGNPARPVVAIVGGAKVSTKIDLLMNLVKKVDALVIGGGMANTFLAARGTDVGKSLCEHDLADTAKQIMIEAATAGCAIVLPVDGVVAREFKAGAASETVDIGSVPADAMILDVGPKTVEAVKRLDRPRRDAGLERPARRLRDRAVRPRDGGGGQARGGAHQGRQADLGRRRRRHGGGAQPCRRRRRLHLCLDRRRRLPRMDGRQAAAGVEVLKSLSAAAIASSEVHITLSIIQLSTATPLSVASVDADTTSGEAK